MSRYSPTRSNQTSSIQQSLENTLELLAESEQEKNLLRTELLSVKKEIRELQGQTQGNQSFPPSGSFAPMLDQASDDSELNYNYNYSTNRNSYDSIKRTDDNSVLSTTIRSEISSFSLFAQNMYHKCLINDSVQETTKEQLQKSSNKLQSISENKDTIVNKTSRFFAEIQNFTKIFIESMTDGTKLFQNEEQQKGANYKLSEEEHIYEIEVQKNNLQNQLFSLRQKANEEIEKNQILIDQIEKEHQQIGKIVQNLVYNKNKDSDISDFSFSPSSSTPLSPIRNNEDRRYVEKQIRLLQTEFLNKQIKISKNKRKLNQFYLLLNEFFEFDSEVDNLSDGSESSSQTSMNSVTLNSKKKDINFFKKLLDDYKDQSIKNESIVKSIINSLSLSPGTDKISAPSSPSKNYYSLQKNKDFFSSLALPLTESDCNIITNEIKSLVMNQKNFIYLTEENEKLKQKNQALEEQSNELNNKNQQTSSNFISLSQMSSQLKSHLSDLEAKKEEIEIQKSNLAYDVANLTKRNKFLEQTKIQNEEEISKISLDNSNMKNQISILQAENENLSEKNQHLDKQIALASTTNTKLTKKSGKLSDEKQSLSGEIEDLTRSFNDLVEKNNAKSDNIEKLTKSLQLANSQVSDLRIKLNELSDENKKLKIGKENYDGILKENKVYKAENEKLSKEILSLNSVREELNIKNIQYQQNQESLDNILNAYQSEKEKTRELNDIKDKYKKLVESYDTIKHENSELFEKCKDIQEIIRKFKDLKVIERQEKAQLKSLKKINSDNTSLKEEYMKLSSELSDFKKLNLMLENDIKNLQNEKKNLIVNSDQVTNSKLLIEKQYEGIQSDYQILKDEFEKNKNDLFENTKKIEDLSKTNSILNENNVNNEAIIKEIKMKIEKLEKENQSLKEKLNDFNKITEENNKFKEIIEKQNIKIKELASSLSTVETAKEHLFNSFDNKIIENKKLNIELNSKIIEFEEIKSSFSSQIDSKEIIILNQNNQIEELKKVINKYGEKINLYQKQNDTLKMQLNNYSSLLKNRENEIYEKESVIEELKEQNQTISEKYSQIEAFNNSLNSQLSAKLIQIEHDENELNELKKINQKLSNSFDRCSLEISELQNDKLTHSQLEKDSEFINTKFEESNRQNDKLIKTVSKMKEKMGTVVQDNEILIRRIDKLSKKIGALSLDLQTKEALIHKLKKLIKSQELSISEYEKQVKILREKNIHFEGKEIWEILKKIQNNLSSFPIDRESIVIPSKTNDFSPREENSILPKLSLIDSMVLKVRELYDEQDNSLERLTSLTSTQHDAIVRISQENSKK